MTRVNGEELCKAESDDDNTGAANDRQGASCAAIALLQEGTTLRMNCYPKPFKVLSHSTNAKTAFKHEEVIRMGKKSRKAAS